MVKYIAIACGILLLVGAYLWVPATLNNEAPQAPAGVDEELWNRGRIVYRVNCTMCHNSNPDLQGPVGPKLRGVSEELLTDRLKNGKGGMPIQPRMVRFIPALREYLK